MFFMFLLYKGQRFERSFSAGVLLLTTVVFETIMMELSRRNGPLFSLVLKLILVLPRLEVKSSFFKCFLSLL